MKYIIGLLCLISLSFGNTSCQKEFTLSPVDSSMITPPGGSSSDTGSFTATIDGVKFIADEVSAAKTIGVIAIAGRSSSGERIVLRVADSAVHTYSLTINSATNAGAYSKDTANAYTTNGGNTAEMSGGILSITNIDTVRKTMSGTFSMKVYRPWDETQKNITEGVFANIPYETTPLPPANATDSFRVKIDGTDFPVEFITAVSFYGKISVSGSDENVGKTVGITVPDNVTPGTYTLSIFGPDYIGQYNASSSIFMSASSGTVTILEHNTTSKRIRGSFNFSAKEIADTSTANITEGYFSVVYQ